MKKCVLSLAFSQLSIRIPKWKSKFLKRGSALKKLKSGFKGFAGCKKNLIIFSFFFIVHVCARGWNKTSPVQPAVDLWQLTLAYLKLCKDSRRILWTHQLQMWWTNWRKSQLKIAMTTWLVDWGTTSSIWMVSRLPTGSPVSPLKSFMDGWNSRAKRRLIKW